MSSSRDTEFDPDRVVIRDKRRLDPDSGEVREASRSQPWPAGSDPAGVDQAGAGPAGAGLPGSAPAPEPVDVGPGDRVAELTADRVAELTADLQRVGAEYANYRKRVERDRVAVVEMATAGLLAGLLPLLDDVDRARTHGDLTGAFQSVGEGLEALTAKLGLERFGEPGDPFDPAVHEAVLQADPDPTAAVAVCAQVLQPGYRLVGRAGSGGRILRPARVSVADPASAQAAEQPTADPTGGSSDALAEQPDERVGMPAD